MVLSAPVLLNSLFLLIATWCVFVEKRLLQWFRPIGISVQDRDFLLLFVRCRQVLGYSWGISQYITSQYLICGRRSEVFTVLSCHFYVHLFHGAIVVWKCPRGAQVSLWDRGPQVSGQYVC